MLNKQVLEHAVNHLGYDMVNASVVAGGLLRVIIDWPWESLSQIPQRTDSNTDSIFVETSDKHITVDDCEIVSKQLQYVCMVENISYQRLEVSSPGLDRALTRAQDFVRFVGHHVELWLHHPFDGRKHYQGILLAKAPEDRQYEIALVEPVDTTPSKIKNKKKSPTVGIDKTLRFSLDEVRLIKLVPSLNFGIKK